MSGEPGPVHSIGGYVPMIDGPEKVSGRAKYTADLIDSGTLGGRIYRSPWARAAVVACADGDKPCGVLRGARPEHPLARERVRYRGEPVAAVAAVDDVTAA